MNRMLRLIYEGRNYNPSRASRKILRSRCLLRWTTRNKDFDKWMVGGEIHSLRECKVGPSPWRSNWWCLLNIKCFPMTQQFQFHYLCQKITLPQLHKEACTRMFIEAFSVICLMAKYWKQLKCLWVGEFLTKFRYIHIMEFHASV